MIISTHAIATIAVGKVIGLSTFKEWVLAFLFGVLIDLDHLKVLRPKHVNNGDWKKFFDRELPTHSFLHEPISLLWIVPLSFLLRTPAPMAAWSIHLFLDYLVDGAKMPFWPFSNLTLKKGILPPRQAWELLLIPVFLLFFFWDQMI